MSAREIQQLVDMGATMARARAALQATKDVMAAAEGIFSGEYDHIPDDDEPIPESRVKRTTRIETPSTDGGDGDAGDDDEELEDDGEEEYMDYDSDNDEPANRGHADVDPYAGIFFSKDRREEVIEVEETPESVYMADIDAEVPLMTQGEWMKGCPEGGEQGFLFQLYTQLSNEACACPNQCGHSIPRQKSLFFPLYPQFSDYITKLRNNLDHKCPTCSVRFCIACGETIDLAKAAKPNYDPTFHCPTLQGLILGVGLATLERVYNDETAGANGKGNKKKRKVASTTATATAGTNDTDVDGDDEDFDMGVPRGKKAKGGTGYAGAVREDTSGQIEALAQQAARDTIIGQLLTELHVFLPSLRREGGGHASDFLVHPTALAHLRRRFNAVGSSLLRNDSLSDMSDRSVLYFELFEWLETISNHEALASMMAMPIMVVSSISSVSTQPQPSSSSSTSKPKSQGKRTPAPRERTIIYEGSSGPRELMEAVVIQAQAAIKGLEGLKAKDEKAGFMTEEEMRKPAMGDDGETTGKGKGKGKVTAANDENSRLLKFCERIVATSQAIDRSLRDTKGAAFVERLHAALPQVNTQSTSLAQSSSSSAKDNWASSYDDVRPDGTEEGTKKAYVDWATKVRFEYCDLSVPNPVGMEGIGAGDWTPNYKFAYNSDVRVMANADIPKRSLAIAKELAVLTTNLPISWDSSIFLRVDETRVDVIKALIIGPEGTPYHNGCFLFDIFLGASYNQAPPSCKYMTTNGGKFRFNPNLYAEGKVCLSLLGTWQGPGWVSGKSTLLQVLISIQSMILCDEPYLNEPSWSTSAGTPQSKAYSANVRRMVVHTAMLGNLKNPPEPFADIIRTHYRIKAKSISAQLDKWLAEDDGRPVNGAGADYHQTAAAAGAGGSSNGMKAHVEEMKKLMSFLNTRLEGGNAAGPK